MGCPFLFPRSNSAHDIPRLGSFLGIQKDMQDVLRDPKISKKNHDVLTQVSNMMIHGIYVRRKIEFGMSIKKCQSKKVVPLFHIHGSSKEKRVFGLLSILKQ